MKPDKNLNEEKLSEQLQRLLLSIEASKRAILPGSNNALLNSIVLAAARLFGAGAASILLVIEEEQVLEFKVAYGPVESKLIGTKFPMDRGIAGYVAMTGQPIATSNVNQDARFDQEFAKSVGYVPESVLATPLLSGDRIIGVMEVFDKIDAASFGMQDMELLGMFAQQAALAIDQSQQINNIQEALIVGLKRLVDADSSQDSAELLSTLEDSLSEQSRIPDLLELADLFKEISALGDDERRACLQILNVFAEYRRSSTSPLRFR